MLDTAVAEMQSRRILLNLFLSAEIVFEDNRDQYGNDFISWCEEEGKVLSPESTNEYLEEDSQYAQSNRDADRFFFWLQIRSINVKLVNLIGWQNDTDTGMKLLAESCPRLESLLGNA